MLSKFSAPSSRLLLLLPILMVLTACAHDKKETKVDDGTPPQAVEDMYNDAAKMMDEKMYVDAQKKFEDVERYYPYSAWATQAQMMAAYAAYQDLRYDDAIIALDRFVDLHPSSDKIDYVLYLKALCYYEQITDVKRDQGMTTDALNALDALINRYPDSTYTREAKIKRDLTRDHLAGKEMDVGRYYLTRGQYTAAINRFVIVVRDYQTTTHTPEALHRLVECYVSLGLINEAIKVASVLGYNYPGSKWYQDSYELLDPDARKKLIENRGVLDRTIESILKPS